MVAVIAVPGSTESAERSTAADGESWAWARLAHQGWAANRPATARTARTAAIPISALGFNGCISFS